MERIAQHSKGLVDDLTEWVELKLRLTQVEIEEKIDAKVNQVAVHVVMGVLAFLAVVFALVTAALGLGAWLGHPAWGFLIVTAVLALAAIIIRAAKPHVVPPPGEKPMKDGKKPKRR